MDLLLKTLFADDDLVLDDRKSADPIATFLERTQAEELRKSLPGVADSRWDTPLEKRQEKPFANPLNFSKGSMGYKLRIDRVEEQVSADGEKWKYAYSGSDLVDVRLIQE